MEIREIEIADEKSAICNGILRSLPSWFGVEVSIREYVEKVRHLPLWAAFHGDTPVGFVALRPQTPYASEVCVMGVRREYHRQGLGRALMETCVQRTRAEGRRYLTVKTLDASKEDAGYAGTRAFYGQMGFIPLEVFPTLWDAENPCLLMITQV